MSTILVCGDRNYRNYKRIWNTLKDFDPSTTTIIHGDCRGADKMAEFAAIALGMKTIAFPAGWKTFGPSAGPIRNRKMLDEGCPDLVIAFHPDIENSKGTKNMIKQSREKGLDIILIEE